MNRRSPTRKKARRKPRPAPDSLGDERGDGDTPPQRRPPPGDPEAVILALIEAVEALPDRERLALIKHIGALALLTPAKRAAIFTLTDHE